MSDWNDLTRAEVIELGKRLGLSGSVYVSAPKHYRTRAACEFRLRASGLVRVDDVTEDRYASQTWRGARCVVQVDFINGSPSSITYS
jgi:hypothetical protein